MLLKSRDFPQADRLESVLLTVIAVGRGARADIDIANNIPQIHGDDRQGRYYRNAAELLGFIRNYRNHARLTELGEKLLRQPSLKNPLFINSVLSLAIYQNLIPYLELHDNGVTRNQVIQFLESISEPGIGPTMIPRRMSTLISWLETLGFLKSQNGKYYLVRNFDNQLPMLELKDIEQPILPTTGELTEYNEISEKIRKASGEITYLKDLAKHERSSNAHIRLVNLVAEKIRENGGLPKSNQLIDLAVRFDKNFIFEMKSISKSNLRSQIRRGLSQLYEYRYLCLAGVPDTELVLVIENELGENESWMLDYLENDRGVCLVWDGDNILNASDKTKQALEFLWK